MKSTELSLVEGPLSPSDSLSLPPQLRFVVKKDKKSGRNELEGLELSDGTQPSDPGYISKLKQAMKRTCGTEDFEVGFEILRKVAGCLKSDSFGDGMVLIAMLLYAASPANEMEALLLGQFLAFQETSLHFLKTSLRTEMFCHTKDCALLAAKLLHCANSTLQTLMKYRSGGKQQIQVIHLSGEAKAVIANEIKGGGR